jgi:flagellar assembly factor FliW
MPVTATELQTKERPLVADTRPSVLLFPEGLPGFERTRHWQAVEHEDARPFLWLQALDNAGINLLVVDPSCVLSDYDPGLRAHDLARVGLTPEDPRMLLSIVTWRADGPTVNLRAPLVLNPGRMLGTQVILEDVRWPMRHPITSDRI